MFEERLRTELGRLMVEVSEGPEISPEMLARIAQISDLLPPRPIARWPVVVIFIITGVLLSAVFFMHMPSTRIELVGETSELSFRTLVTSAYAITEKSLSASLGPVRAVPPIPGKVPGEVCSDLEGRSEFTLLRPSNASDAVSINPIDLPAETRVTIGHRGAAARYQVDFAPSNRAQLGDIQVGLAGPWRGLLGSCKLTSDSATPDAIRLRVASGELLSIILSPKAPAFPEPTNIPVDMISFLTVRNVSDEGSVRPMSHLKSGVLNFVSLGDKQRTLREAELLRLVSPRGELQTLSIGARYIRFRFSGTVERIITGDELNLMPTWFEWLSSRHALISLWGALLYVAGIVIGLMRWWGSPSVEARSASPAPPGGRS